MTVKKSGLADSPFFRPSVPSLPQPTPVSQGVLVPVFPTVQANERTVEHLNTRTVEQVNDRTSEQLNDRTPERPVDRTVERLNTRTVERPERTVSRKSYDIFDDQSQAIDELVLKWSKERKKYITKGQVMRELLDEIISTKRK